MTQWYYAVKGDRKGPVDLASIESLIKDGTLSASDLVWNPDMGSSWSKISEVPTLKGGTEAVKEVASPEVESPPPVEQNPMMAHFAKADPSSAEEPDEDLSDDIKRWKRRSILGKVVLLAVVVGVGVLCYMKFFYKSPAFRAYSEFAQALFEYRCADAAKYVEEGPLRDYYESCQGKKRGRPDGTYVRIADPVSMAMPEIHSKKYVALSQEYGDGRQAVNLEVEQRVGVLISISPYHIVVVRHHKAKMVKTEDGWKVAERPELEKKGYFSPSSGQKVWDEPASF